MRKHHLQIVLVLCGLSIPLGIYCHRRSHSHLVVCDTPRVQTPPGAAEMSKLCELVERGDMVGVRSLLNRGANPRFIYRYSWAYGDALGKTDMPLIALAARSGHADLVRLLVEYRANLEDLCSDEPVGRGTTALGMAAFSGRKAAVVALIELGACVEPRVKWDARPLRLGLCGQLRCPTKYFDSQPQRLIAAKPSTGRSSKCALIPNLLTSTRRTGHPHIS